MQFKHKFRWDWDNVIEDLDGSMTGQAGALVVSSNAFTEDNPNCQADVSFKRGSVCNDTQRMVRFAFNNFSPSLATLLNVTNSANKTVVVPMLKKRLTHKLGYMMILEANQAYEMQFDNVDKPSNISYKGVFYNLGYNDYLIIKHPLAGKPDQIWFDNEQQQEYFELSPSNNSNGDWSWDEGTSTLHYLIKNTNSKRDFLDINCKFEAIKCRYVNCKLPESPALKAPVTERSPDACYWSDPNTWLATGVPKDDDSIVIPEGKYIVVDTILPKFRILTIEGML